MDIAKKFHSDSSVARLTSEDNVGQAKFLQWIWGTRNDWEQIYERWLKETGNPAGGFYHDHGSSGGRGLTQSHWSKMILEMGFPGTAEEAAAVWKEISREAHGDKKVRNPLLNLEVEISLAQIKLFAKRAGAVNQLLDAQDKNSPARRLVRLLLDKYGSSLLAWRTVMDLHCTGRISYPDFANACRRLGLHSQGKQLWMNLRQDNLAALEFQDLDPLEGENLEAFAESLWNKVGFDLQEAWRYLDPSNLQYVCYGDFKEGCEKLGFKGNTRLLFKGLDMSGLGVGRVKRTDLDYMMKVSRVAKIHLRVGTIVANTGLEDLIAWTKREMGTPEELISQLGLIPGQTQIQFSEFVARLAALGFEGDALSASSIVARYEGGSVVSVETLGTLLSGGRPTSAAARARTPTRSRPPRSASNGRWAPPRSGWYDSVDIISDRNTVRCHHIKQFFVKTPRDEASSPRPTSPRSTPRSGSVGSLPRYDFNMPRSRPDWEQNTDHKAQMANEENGSYCRTYFSDPLLKPERDKRRAELLRRRLEKGF